MENEQVLQLLLDAADVIEQLVDRCDGEWVGTRGRMGVWAAEGDHADALVDQLRMAASSQRLVP